MNSSCCCVLSSTPAEFEQKAQEFNDYLSSLFTDTITEHPLQPIIRPNIAFISFKGMKHPRYRPSVALGNGCRIRVGQTILPNPEALTGVTTLEYMYSYILGPNPRTDWLARYEYEPDKKTNQYPVPHVHFNGTSVAYDEFPARQQDKPLHDLHFPTDRVTAEDFVEHLIIEFDTPTHNGKRAALELIDERRRVFHEQHRTRWPTYSPPEQNA